MYGPFFSLSLLRARYLLFEESWLPFVQAMLLEDVQLPYLQTNHLWRRVLSSTRNRWGAFTPSPTLR